MNEQNHNKIIMKAAREVLALNGLLQKGQSRIWLDDNGWFFTVVEFQPSGWEKGTFLNVGMHYLWANKEYLTFDCGYREHECVVYTGDDAAFYAAVRSLAQQAMEKVLFYRAFRQPSAAHSCLAQQQAAPCAGQLYQKMMLCALGKEAAAQEHFKALLAHCTKAAQPGALYAELTDKIQPVVEEPTAFYAYVRDKIRLQRSFWRAKASMKNLPLDTEFL